MSDKKYEVTEKGKDIFGNKKYDVVEKTKTDNELNLGGAILIFILTNLITGLYTWIIYKLLFKEGKDEDKIFMKSSIYSLLVFIYIIVLLLYIAVYNDRDYLDYTIFFILFSIVTGVITSVYRFIKLWNQS
jgi:hypothetical protein